MKRKDILFFLTSSNSYLLNDELSTKLTGRYITFEIYTNLVILTLIKMLIIY